VDAWEQPSASYLAQTATLLALLAWSIGQVVLPLIQATCVPVEIQQVLLQSMGTSKTSPLILASQACRSQAEGPTPLQEEKDQQEQEEVAELDEKRQEVPLARFSSTAAITLVSCRMPAAPAYLGMASMSLGWVEGLTAEGTTVALGHRLLFLSPGLGMLGAALQRTCFSRVGCAPARAS